MEIENLFITNSPLFEKTGEYAESASSLQKSLKIELKNVPEDDSSLASTYGNICGAYKSIDDYSSAIEKYKKVTKS